VTIYERLYAQDPSDFDVAGALADLYSRLDRKQDLARLYGGMADTSSSADERARLRLLRAELLVEGEAADTAISVLRQTLGELAIHEPSVRMLSTLLENKRALPSSARCSSRMATSSREPSPSEPALCFCAPSISPIAS
jgi:hypothetical protein